MLKNTTVLGEAAESHLLQLNRMKYITSFVARNSGNSIIYVQSEQKLPEKITLALF